MNLGFFTQAELPSAGRRQASIRDLDYLGIVLFTAGVVPFMLGLTNKGNVDSGADAPAHQPDQQRPERRRWLRS